MGVVTELWTDGSGNTADRPGGWAYVLVARRLGIEVARKEAFGGVSVGGSNNRMELSAVLFGLRAIERPNGVVTVFTDSEYVARAFPEGWLEKWDKEGWETPKNADLWRDLRIQVRRLGSVEWQHIPGHSGLKLNDRADFLAGRARKAMVALLNGEAKG